MGIVTLRNHEDTNAEATAAIQQRLAAVGDRRARPRVPRKFGLRTLVIVFALTPILIWRLVLVWPAISATLKSATTDLSAALLITRSPGASGETSLIIGCLVPVSIASMLVTVSAFVMVRRMEWRARYGALTALCVGGSAVIVATIFWCTGQGGITSMALAKPLDVVTLYALPLGIGLLIGATAGWQVAELG